MKFKLRFQKRSSVFITIIACAASIWMMVDTFGLPADSAVRFAVISVLLLLGLILTAIPIALIARWLIDRREK